MRKLVPPLPEIFPEAFLGKLLWNFSSYGILLSRRDKDYIWGKWGTAEQRKAFFEKYASDHHFDALIAEN